MNKAGREEQDKAVGGGGGGRLGPIIQDPQAILSSDNLRDLKVGVK